MDQLVDAAERARLAAEGYIAADMESARCWPRAAGRPAVRGPGGLRHPAATRCSPGIGARRAWPRCGRCGRPRRSRERWAAACGPRQVLLAGPRSFCAGVERAIEIVERALELPRRAGLRAQADRAQHPRGRRPGAAAARSSSTSSTRCPTARPWCSPRTAYRPRSAHEAGAPRAGGDRRDLPAGLQGARRGPAVRRRRLHGRADRPRGPRGGRGHARRGAGTR